MERSFEYSIMVVDDDKANLDVLDNTLKDKYAVYIAKNGASAIKRAQTYKPDLILLDVVMPDMSGYDVFRILKDSAETRNIPIIFITGLDSIADEEKGLRIGAVDYITKPFHTSIIRARVNTQIQLIRQIRTIERFGLIDALTEIPNRRSFDNQLNIEWLSAIRRQTPISLLMLDLDKFKNYNDAYGHPQGDAALKMAAEIFRTTLQRTTDLVFRWGGEEFAVLLPDTEVNGALHVAERIRAAMEDNGCLTVSIGVSSDRPDMNSTSGALLEQADKALYDAKNTGRNKVCAYNRHSAEKDALLEIHARDAMSLLASQWWVGKTDIEIVEKQLSVREMFPICEYPAFRDALSRVLERTVHDDEFKRMELLRNEYKRKTDTLRQ